MEPQPIAAAFDRLLYDLHRLKHSDHRLAELYSSIEEIELASGRLHDAIGSRPSGVGRLARSAVVAVDALRELLDRARGDRWIRARIELIRMDIDEVLAVLSSFAAAEERALEES